MANQFSSGKNSIAECDRSSVRFVPRTQFIGGS